MSDKHHRSIAKGATWRVIGTLDTVFLSLVFTGKIGKALTIGTIELFTKILLFYLHERIWMRLAFGTEEKIIDGALVKKEKHYRSLVKGISWRIVGSLDTFWIALFVNRGTEHAAQTAFYIAATEVITKVFLFWLHERAWMNIKWGKDISNVS